MQPAQQAADLFGDDDDAPVQNEGYNPYEDLEDDIPDEPAQPAQPGPAAVAAPAPVTAEERRAALLKLAQKKKREAVSRP